MNFRAQLGRAKTLNDSVLCVGLDPDPGKFPGSWKDDAARIFDFCATIVDATKDLVIAFKPQIAYFAAQRAEEQLERLIAHIHRVAPEVPVILDAKRGDIGTTAEGYARATIGAAPGFDADAVTVNPYMGKDTLEPFITRAQTEAKGVAVLVRTSNPGAGDFQDLQVGDAPLWRRVAEMLAPECPRLRGASGWSGLMAVAGATYPDEARVLREAMPEALFLVPGYGAQGASAADAVAGFVQGGRMREGGVVSSSRAVLYPQAAQAATNLNDWRAAISDAMTAAAGELRAACTS